MITAKKNTVPAGYSPVDVGKPGLQFVQVLHDDLCKLLRGVDACNCNPDVVVYAYREQH